MDPASENNRTNEIGQRRCLSVLLMLLTLLGMPQAEAADREEANEAIATAIAARQQAAAVGGEWRDTETLIAEAQDTAQRGDYQQALDLAHWAAEQGKLGYLQAISQRSADFPAYFQP